MSLVSFILDLLFPAYCVHCQRYGEYLCPNCYQQLSFLSGPQTVDKMENLDELLVMARYEPPLPALIAALKYQSVKPIGNFMAELIYHSLVLPKVDYITAIPLHPRRQRQRGFNQAEVIAIKLSQLTKIPYVPFLLRTRHTPRQAKQASRAARQTNLLQAFAWNPQLTLPSLSDRLSILLIDDVTTTGTTLNEAAHVLKQHHIYQVTGLTLAHGT